MTRALRDVRGFTMLKILVALALTRAITHSSVNAAVQQFARHVERTRTLSKRLNAAQTLAVTPGTGNYSIQGTPYALAPRSASRRSQAARS